MRPDPAATAGVLPAMKMVLLLGAAALAGPALAQAGRNVPAGNPLGDGGGEVTVPAPDPLEQFRQQQRIAAAENARRQALIAALTPNPRPGDDLAPRPRGTVGTPSPVTRTRPAGPIPTPWSNGIYTPWEGRR